MSEKKKNNENKSTPVYTADAELVRNRRPSKGDRVRLVNENYRNYSEVDRDTPPPPPSRQ